ncbi:unnamed protein product, partial [Urochloa humidicola]
CKRAISRRLAFPRRIHRFPLASGGLCVAGEQGELGIWWRMYISPTNKLVLGLVVFLVRDSSGIFCFFHAFSGGVEVDVGGGRSLVLLERHVEHETGVLCRGFDIDELEDCLVPARWFHQRVPCQTTITQL